MRRVAVIAFIIFLNSIFIGCSKSEPPEISDLVAFFEKSGLKVSEEGIRNYDSMWKTASALGSGRPNIRTVKVNGVLTTILHFKSEEAAENFYNVMVNMPAPEENLPKRMKKALGTPKLFLHRNFVLRVVEGLNERDDAKEVERVRATLENFPG